MKWLLTFWIINGHGHMIERHEVPGFESFKACDQAGGEVAVKYGMVKWVCTQTGESK